MEVVCYSYDMTFVDKVPISNTHFHEVCYNFHLCTQST